MEMQQQTMSDQNQTSQPAMPQQIVQQMQQQMVLCPVRVVYETQILMQPDQMQPNQTFFINSQNQPPWIQNRQIPNQVIYLQHAPNNIVPSMPQQTEQSHFYLQQPYQQIVQHPMLAQNQENIMRSYQMTNVMPTNVIQNVQNNIGSNFPNQISQHTDPTPNYGLINSNIGSNIPITQINTLPLDRQDTIMQGMENQQINNQKQMYMNVGQQINQQGMIRPQLMTLNPIQQTSPSVQMFEQTSQVQNITTNTPQIIPRTFVTAKQTTQPIRMKTVTVNNMTPTNLRTIDQNYACRPIKPRPEYKPNIPNFPNTLMQIPRAINTVNMNPNVYNKLPIPPATTVPNNDTIKNNRKRKSESPDELTPKLTVININTTVAQPLVNHVKSIDVGINTSPIHKPINYTLHKPNNNVVPDKSLTNINNTGLTANDSTVAKPLPQNLKPNTKDHKAIDTHNIKQESPINKSDSNTKDIKQDDNHKLVRYTVFPQSRVRPKEEVKVNVNVLKDTKNIINADDDKLEHIAENSKILLKEKILSKNEEKNSKVNDGLLTGVNVNVMNAKDSNSNEKGKEYVLTHVLDGLVIQESNKAFPIKDSIKKPMQTETKCSDRKREVVKEDELLKNNCLELPVSEKKLQEKAVDKDAKVDDIENPFVNVNATAVKSWTIAQLTSFLSKHKWDETVSLLQDHEIDGESLFLVSKSQLLRIGIKEKHADIICDYAKS